MDNIIQKYLKNAKTNNIPKFVMFSGHDYLIAAVQIFLNTVFGIPCFYPNFGSNQFFELHIQDGIDMDKLNESHFHVEYFYDGNLLLNISYVDFKEEIKSHIWSYDKINNFCKVDNQSLIDYILYIILIVSNFYIIFVMFKENMNEKKNRNSARSPFIPKTFPIRDN